MTLLAFSVLVAFCALGTGLITYSLGYAHGRQEANSEKWERQYKRFTPEPARVRLLPSPLADPCHPCFFDQDGPA